MHRNFYSAEILILLLLYYLGWNNPSYPVLNCSRTKSHLVRMIIHKKIIPILLRYKLSLPLSCPFHNERDVLWWPNVQIDFLDGSWMCPFCGAAFSSEEIVMNHWDGKHTHYETEDSICLARFCDIFRCEVILTALEMEKLKVSSDGLPSIHYNQNKIQCDERKMFVLQKKCKVIMRQCLLDMLPSMSDKDYQDIEDEINVAICSYLTCNKYLDGSLQTIQPVPVIVCIIVGSLLLGGFCLCYYVFYSIS
ncbi:uncharacterized protein LOC129233195, partial [Uloborus diversus]|uniref:uncharacterized protein LOC129233195 n=1 Tax=Uloborus diversus TaxID=327109 RepID=UPI00240A25C7